MEIYVISIVAFVASMLTFFSGFGLGTILTPAFVLFFPVEVSITLTGIAHLLNNFFKIGLVGKHINLKIGIKFGATAIIGAFAGAQLLILFTYQSPLYTYTINQRLFSITTLKLILSILMIVFVLFDLLPSLNKIQFQNRLYSGGLISGFFGGLTGNQGALRSMFLVKSGLIKESFIATGVFIACLVDVTRLSIYFDRLSSVNIQDNLSILIAAIVSAFTGAYVGNKLLKKVTFNFVQQAVAIMIIVLAIGLGSGLI